MRKNNLGKRIFLYSIGTVCVVPAVIVVFRSFMDTGDGNFGTGLSDSWTLLFYDRLLFTRPDYYEYFWNSVKYTAAVLPAGLAVSMLSGYGFACCRFRLREPLFVLFLVLMLMPFQATLVPQYLLMKHLGLLNNGASVILPNIFNPFGTVLVAQYMMGMDRQIFEAGRLDGLGGFGQFIRLALPMSVPIVGAYLILTFLDCWAMLEQPLIFLQDVEKYPLSVRLNSYPDSLLFPGSVVYMILPFLIFGMGKKALVKGIGFYGKNEKGSLADHRFFSFDGDIDRCL